MLANWSKRSPAANDGEIVVDLFATELEGETEHGTYYVQRAGGDGWEAKFRPVGARLDQRMLAIDARDEAGESQNWETRGCANEAINLHARLMALGHGAFRAAELVAERSQQLHREWRARRPVTLAYGGEGRT